MTERGRDEVFTVLLFLSLSLLFEEKKKKKRKREEEMLVEK